MENQKEILIIDDDTELTSAINDHYKKVDGCNNLHDAYNKMRQNPLKYVLLDMSLGSENALNYIRPIKDVTKAKVIVTSRHSGNDIMVDVYKKGADGFIRKPLKKEHIDELLEQSLNSEK